MLEMSLDQAICHWKEIFGSSHKYWFILLSITVDGYSSKVPKRVTQDEDGPILHLEARPLTLFHIN